MFFIKIRYLKFHSFKLVSNAFIWKSGYIRTLGFKSKYLLNTFDKMFYAVYNVRIGKYRQQKLFQ